MAFDTFFPLVQEGDPVQAGTVNRPLRSLDGNVRYLWDLLQAASLGSTVYARQQTVEAAAEVGMAVWYNSATGRFERGLAVATGNPSGVVYPAPQAQAWGVVALKSNTTLADILLFGLDAVDVSGVTDTGGDSPGTYYLSATVPGGLTRERPPVAVPVLRSLGDGQVLVAPQFIDALNAGFATEATVVLTLHGDSRIKVSCYGQPDQPAASGDLQLTLDLNLAAGPGSVTGYDVFKGFDPASALFEHGPVCEGLYAQSPNVILTGPASRPLNPGGPTLYQGPVGIAVASEVESGLDVQLVRLDGAEEEYFQDIMYLGFVPGVERSYRAKIHVRDDLTRPAPTLVLRFLILGRAAGTLPALAMTARIVPRPSPGQALPLPLSSAEFAVTCDTAVTLAGPNTYVEVDADPFPVAPGDTVYFTVTRPANDGYPGEVGILHQEGILAVGS